MVPFKVIKAPFTQLYSIHAFVKQNGDVKQVPLVFVLMSGKRKCDYRRVLKAVQNLLPDHIELQCVVADFESALWRAVEKVFPDAGIKGCVFHWTQAIWRKVQALGLASTYQNNDAAHKFIRQIMALPFLPHEHIPQMFMELKDLATSPALRSLVEYVQATWLESTVLSPDRWSIFNQSVCTNNDVEGWHRRLNHHAGRAKLPMYLLINLLHQESNLVSLQVRLLSEKKLKRHQHRKFKNLQAKIFGYWTSFTAGKMNTRHLLRVCSHLNALPADK